MSSLLETLPLELLYAVFQYLYSLDAPKHPLIALSSVSRSLRDAVESYSIHALRQHHARFPRSAPRPPFNTGAHPRTYRRTYLFHTLARCVFCNWTTQCVAKVFNDLRCCRKCDKVQWPDKITLTQARKKYGLSRDVLERSCKHWGVYICMGVLTTMFLEGEVKKVADRIHGGLEEWMERRTALSLLKKTKKERQTAQRVIVIGDDSGEA